jgi:hypothetical protein
MKRSRLKRRPSRLTRIEWDKFLDMVEKANNPELQRMEDVVSKEIRLSEGAIGEGFEKNGKLRKFFERGI